MAPLLGLLGTVWGMMQAFRSIAFDDAQARGMAMAYAVSEAMITTAGGLLLAIPCMAMYFFLRSRVIRIIAEVEAQATEALGWVVRSRESPPRLPEQTQSLVKKKMAAESPLGRGKGAARPWGGLRCSGGTQPPALRRRVEFSQDSICAPPLRGEDLS